MYSTIVVGSDGSPTAQSAVARAGELAGLCGDVTVHLVHGSGAPIAVADGIIGAPIVLSAENLEEIDALLETQASAIRSDGVTVETHVRQQSGSEAVLSVAEEVGADLIVVGSQGMTGKKRFILGSVPNAVSHHAPCSVLIVHTHDT